MKVREQSMTLLVPAPCPRPNWARPNRIIRYRCPLPKHLKNLTLLSCKSPNFAIASTTNTFRRGTRVTTEEVKEGGIIIVECIVPWQWLTIIPKLLVSKGPNKKLKVDLCKVRSRHPLQDAQNIIPTLYNILLPTLSSKPRFNTLGSLILRKSKLGRNLTTTPPFPVLSSVTFPTLNLWQGLSLWCKVLSVECLLLTTIIPHPLLALTTNYKKNEMGHTLKSTHWLAYRPHRPP